MKQRNLGIEFLRIVSMFMVVLLHVVGAGGALEHAVKGSVNYWVLYFIQTAAYCAVNCFALITGYVMYGSKFRVSKVLGVVWQTLFYTAVLTGVCFIVLPQTRNLSMTITALLPITGKSHWYVSAYIGVCVLSPLLNQALQSLNKKALTLCLLAIFLLFSVIPSILSFVSGDPSGDPYGLRDGYSMIWLSLLYLLGGYLRKYDILQKIKSSRAWRMYTMSICFTFVCNVFLQYATTAFFGEQKLENFMRSYISPTIIIAALGLFVACARLRIPKRTEKVISFVSRAAFGVYLIHACPPIWENVIMGMTASFAQYNTFALIACVFGTAVVIYFLCTLIELCRIYLFKKCRIDRIAIKVEQAISKKIAKMKWLNIEEEETAVQEQAM